MTITLTREEAQQVLPCPFCGETDVSVVEGDTFRWVLVECNTCGTRAGEVRKQTIGAGTPEQWLSNAKRDAIEAWNTRTAPPQRKWQGLTDADFSAINQSCSTKLQAATSAESILKEKNT